MGQSAAQKRSAAAKKAAATRRKKQDDEAKATAAQQNPDDDPSQEITKSEEETVEPYRPQHKPLAAAGLDQARAEDERQAELDEEREEHNRRTGDASLPMGRHRTGDVSDWVGQDRPN